MMMQPTPAPSSPPRSPRPPEETASESYPSPPQNRDSAPFQVLVHLFEKLSNERKQDKRRRVLDTWFNHWREEKGYDLYPVLRLILPQKDRERAVYGLKEKNLAKTYIKLIPLGTRDPDAIRLLNWKKPTERDKSSGDFPTVLYEVVSKRSSVIEGSLSVADLNDILDDLAKNMGKHDTQSKILQRIYNRTTPEEQRWIVRIILKDMVISVKETTVFSVFHPDAQDLYNTCSDLKKVAWTLWDPERRLNEEDKAVQLFYAFAPMLCKRPTRKIEDSVKEMQGHQFIIEEKLDGERMQLHKRGNEYFYCSRKGKDYTYLYGKHVGTGSLTPFIDKAFDDRIDDIILDGEMLVWDPVSERNLPFGTLKTAALDKSNKNLNPRPCFKVFDLLYLNGMPLLQKSLSFRKRNLHACITEIPGRIEFTIEFKGKTAKDVRERMDEVMASRGEGLVIKHPDAEYVLNGRNRDWIKVKPEYMDNMGETVDVLVVSGFYGSGKRGGGVSTIVCAVLDDRVVDEDEPKYSTFVRIGSGLSFADYAWIRSKPWKVWDPKSPPSFLLTAAKGQDDKGDMYLEPEDSFIIKIKAAEIVASIGYHIGLTMRFPRAAAIRDDLGIEDCLTATALLDGMRTDKKRKMESDAGMTKKRRKVTTKKLSVLQEHQGPSTKGVPVDSDLFDGLTFVVSSDPKSRTGKKDQDQLKQLIHVNGGKCVLIAKNKERKDNFFVVYGGKVIPYDLQLIISKGIYDVIKPQWVLDSVAVGELAPLSKKYFFHATDSSKLTDEYNVDDDDKVGDGHQPKASASASPHLAKPDAEVSEDVSKPEGSGNMDPLLADWFQVGEEGTGGPQDDSETETENDSDNADVKNENEEGVDDDWLDVKTPEIQGSEREAAEPSNMTPDAKMGETDAAMEYDQDAIFKHLCFYLDSPDNARLNGLPVKSKYEADLTEAFDGLSKLILENGGRVASLTEPRLTHLVLDKRDISRRMELMKRTSKPKRRHLVISQFIQACLDEESLLDEEEFAP